MKVLPRCACTNLVHSILFVSDRGHLLRTFLCYKSVCSCHDCRRTIKSWTWPICLLQRCVALVIGSVVSISIPTTCAEASRLLAADQYCPAWLWFPSKIVHHLRLVFRMLGGRCGGLQGFMTYSRDSFLNKNSQYIFFMQLESSSSPSPTTWGVPPVCGFGLQLPVWWEEGTNRTFRHESMANDTPLFDLLSGHW